MLDATRNYRTGWPKPGDGSPCPGLQYLPPDDNDDDDGARTGTKCHAKGDMKGGIEQLFLHITTDSGTPSGQRAPPAIGVGQKREDSRACGDCM